MATEDRRFSLVAVVVHTVAIAVGLYLGWTVMGNITPDLPDSSIEPGVSATGEVTGDSAESLFRATNLEPALTQLQSQMVAGEGLTELRIEPDTLGSKLNSGDGLFQPTDVPADAPVVLTHSIDSERGGPPIDLGKIAYIDLVATRDGPRWYVQLDTGEDIGPPPWTYGAPLDVSSLEAGPAPPKPIR